jgi:uncharacterized membrane protein
VLAFAATTRQRWLLAQALLALGVALKLYPLILMPLVVVDEWRTTRRFPREALLGGAIGLLLAIGSMLLLAPTETVGMVRYHRDRPLEFEAVGASLAWLLGPTTAEFSFGSWNLLSPLGPVLIPLLTAAAAALLLAVYGGYGWGRLSRAGAWLLALLVGLVTSKVLSTQYLQWALPFVVLALWEADAAGRSGWLARLRWRRLWIVLCVLTSVIYPIGLERFAVPAMIAQEAPGWFMGLVTLRNALLIVACGFALRQSLIPNARIQGQQPGDQGEHEPTA